MFYLLFCLLLHLINLHLHHWKYDALQNVLLSLDISWFRSFHISWIQSWLMFLANIFFIVIKAVRRWLRKCDWQVLVTVQQSLMPLRQRIWTREKKDKSRYCRSCRSQHQVQAKALKSKWTFLCPDFYRSIKNEKLIHFQSLGTRLLCSDSPNWAKEHLKAWDLSTIWLKSICC